MLSGGGARGCGGEPGVSGGRGLVLCARGSGAGPCTGRRVSPACAWRVHVRSTAASWPGVTRGVPRAMETHAKAPEPGCRAFTHPTGADLRRLRLWAPCCPWGGSSLGPLLCIRERGVSARQHPSAARRPSGQGPSWLAHLCGWSFQKIPGNSPASRLTLPPPLISAVWPSWPCPQSPPTAPWMPLAASASRARLPSSGAQASTS